MLWRSPCHDSRLSRSLKQDHMYGLPMVDVKWHTGPGGERRVLSSDSRIAKIWCAQENHVLLSQLEPHTLASVPACVIRDASNGTAFTSIEPEADINDVCIWPGSGASTQSSSFG